MIQSISMTPYRIYVLLTALVFAGLACNGGANGKPEKEPRAHKVVRDDLVVSVSATGVVEPEYKVEVKSKASGEILEFPHEPGDSVKKGEVLIRLDQKTEQRNVALMEADLSKARAELESAKADLLEKNLALKRTRTLLEKQLISGQELDSAVAHAAVAQARVSQIGAIIEKASLVVEDARERLAETVIESPIDGVIVEKTVERGQIITSGITSVTGGTRLLVVADLTRLYVYALVDETDIGQVAMDQKVTVSVDAYPEQEFDGVVQRIYPVGETSDNITVFRVKVEILGDRKTLLRPGMTANVDIILRKRPNALIVPDEAVAYDPDDEKKGAVTVKTAKGNIVRQVTLGETNGFETEVTTGLKEGEMVLIKPPIRQ
ncbi:MAG: efflux RND transporter periplasmic adaptor subunit [Nitrospinota bacterium]|nr:efflux RND transporter periplasmic adaptor subunit [Nitrospinota bacterium]